MQSIQATTQRLRTGTHTLESIYGAIIAHGDSPAAQYDRDGEIRYITFTEYDRRVRHTAAALQKILGVPQAATFIGIRMDNSPDYFTLLWGTVMAGYQPVLLDFRLDEKQTAHLVAETRALAVITPDAFPLQKGVRRIDPKGLTADCDGAVRGGFANRVAMCTSGTTASSRVYVYDGQALCAALMDMAAFTRVSRAFLNDKPHRVLAFLPFHHIFGFITMVLTYTAYGKTLVFPRDRAVKSVQAACRLHGVTHLFNVPVFWNGLAQKTIRAARQKGEEKERALLKLIDGYNKRQRLFPKGARRYYAGITHGIRKSLLGTHLSCCVSGGGRILPEALRIINGVGYPLVNGFGMTELGVTGVQALGSIDDQLSGSVGRPMQGVKYKIKPTDPTKPHVGELLIKSAAMHTGRMQAGMLLPPEVDEEGFFHTGDIGRLEGGKLWIEGRLKDVIINESGENVYPDELEDAFMAVEGVEQLCAFGMETGGLYEDITLIVYAGDIPENPKKLDALIADLSRVNGALPLYKRVRRCYFCLAPLPLTASLKVKRQGVKADFAAGRLDTAELDLSKRRVRSPLSAPAAKAEQNEEYLEILRMVKAFFAEELALSAADIGDRAHFIYDLGGDSLASLGVFTKIEEHFGALITDAEYTSCTCAEDAAALLLDKRREGMTGGKRRRITAFEESGEWAALCARLKEAEAVGNPYFVPHDSPLRDTSLVHGREVINYGSYNYLCLSGHPRTVKAAQDAAAQYGTSASGSRLLAGEKTLHQELEAAIAAWKHTKSALVLVGGHSTNVTFVGNFCSDRDLILYDALIHNSVTEGCKLSAADAKGFPHNDCAALESILRANRDRYEKVLIVVEGVYSMDGDIAPIPEFVRIKQAYGCFLMVDEAHSSCVIGKTGGGVDEYFNLKPTDIDIKMGTLSKGLGACGGYLAGPFAIIEYLRYYVPGFVFSVGLSPVLAAATLEGVRMLQEPGCTLVPKLQANIRDFMAVAAQYGFDTCLAGETAVIPILIGDDQAAFALSKRLLDEGIFVPPAVYPAVPKGQARLRFCLTSGHKPEQAQKALSTLDRLIREHGFAVPRNTNTHLKSYPVAN